ncbi:MAG: hypothetical protein ITG00_11020, partial [Flavobacterium sp.]|nr:hypothetical protein [Flavobacterium sp.]
KNEIFAEIVQRLRNRSAEFDKIIQDDGDGDFVDQLHDRDAEIIAPATFVTIVMNVDDSTREILENDPDLIFVKAIAAMQNENLQIEGDTVHNNIAHLTFS